MATKLKKVAKDQKVSAKHWNELARLLSRKVTGPDVHETIDGYQIRRSP